jgi:hypothetical protein
MRLVKVSGHPLGDKNWGYCHAYDKFGKCVGVSIFPLDMQRELGIED